MIAVKHTVLAVILIAAAVTIVGLRVATRKDSVGFGGPNSQSNSSPSAKTSSKSAFNKSRYSLSDPASIWVIVNKKRPLNPINYTPTDLVVPSVPLRVPGNDSMQIRKITARALETMFAAAKDKGLVLMLSSGYRSYAYQTNLYNGYTKASGRASADKSSARPGHSEHQTGLAVDIEPASRLCELEQCFATTPEGKWLAANAYKYGFILRYTSDKVSVTGYENEPWHYRYVGTDLAIEMHKDGIKTLEEFFGVQGGTSY